LAPGNRKETLNLPYIKLCVGVAYDIWNSLPLCWDGQNRIYAQYVTVKSVISLPEIQKYRTYVILANPYVTCLVMIRFDDQDPARPPPPPSGDVGWEEDEEEEREEALIDGEAGSGWEWWMLGIIAAIIVCCCCCLPLALCLLFKRRKVSVRSSWHFC